MDEFAYTVKSLRDTLSKALERLDPEQELFILERLQDRLQTGKRHEADELHSAHFLTSAQVTKEKRNAK